MKGEFLDRAASLALIAVAAVVAATALRREFSTSPDPANPRMVLSAVDDWATVQQRTVWLDAARRVEVVQFGDFQCPFCRRFAAEIEALPDSSRRLIRLGVVNFPLPTHLAARSAALEFLCATNVGNGRRAHDALFAAQDSLVTTGVRRALAHAGLTVSRDHERCVSGDWAKAHVDSSIALGRALGVRGTPTVIVDGWRMSRPPQGSELEVMVNEIARGGDPARALRRMR